MEYEFTSTDKEKFSLHDCFAKSVELTGDRLVFRLPEGFYCMDYSKDWPNTGKAEVEFIIDKMRGASFNLFVEEDGKTVRNEFTIEQLVEKINNNEWELEFAYRYDGYQEILYKCWVWEVAGRRTYESELWIGTQEDVIFRWDKAE